MSLFNLFFRTTDEQRRNENTLDKQYKSAKKKINDFIDLTKSITANRKILFNDLMSFVLDGEQWTNAEIKDLDGDMDLVFNFSENYLERYMARLFPRNPHTGVLEIGVKVYSSEQSKEKQERAILDFYKESGLVSVLLEQGINYLCAGAGIFYYPEDPITKKAKLISLDPKDCYLGWSGSELVQFAYQDYVGDNKFDIYYWDLAMFLHYDAKKNQYFQQKNEFDFIPVSWIPNNPKPHKHEGRPKTVALYNLDRAYNFASTDFSRRIADNTDPPLAIFSDSVDIKNVERGRRKKTRLGKDDDAKYLELKEGKEILSYLEMIESKIKTKAGIVDSSGAIRAQLSGVSLSFQYSDMMDLVGFMRIAWDTAFRKMNNAILSYQFGEKEYKTDPVYHPFLSLDNKQRIEEYVLMLKNKIISVRDAIDEIRGVENPEEKLKEIIEEAKKLKVDDQNDKNKDI